MQQCCYDFWQSCTMLVVNAIAVKSMAVTGTVVKAIVAIGNVCSAAAVFDTAALFNTAVHVHDNLSARRRPVIIDDFRRNSRLRCWSLAIACMFWRCFIRAD
jgi:hypothetical protein